MTFAALFETRNVLLIAGSAIAFGLCDLSFLYYDLVRARERQERRVDALLRLSKGRAAGGGPSATKERGEAVDRVFRLRQRKLQGREIHELAQRLGRFGLPQEQAGSLYVVFRLGLGILLAVLLLLFAGRFGALSSPLRTLAIFFIGIGVGWYTPTVALGALARRRVKEIGRALPEAMELLIIAVEAGLALEDALERIVIELRLSRPALAQELALTAADLKILPDRSLALKNFARRVDVPSVRSVTTTLSQTMRYGTPLAQALRIVAGELRDEALAQLEERANRMPVLLTLPMVVFIFPSVFILAGGPALLQVIDKFVR